MYAKFTDYVVVVNLQDFYVNITNYFITTSKEGVANVNFKIISTSNGKILVAKNAELIDIKKSRCKTKLSRYCKSNAKNVS